MSERRGIHCKERRVHCPMLISAKLKTLYSESTYLGRVEPDSVYSSRDSVSLDLVLDDSEVMHNIHACNIQDHCLADGNPEHRVTRCAGSCPVVIKRPVEPFPNTVDAHTWRGSHVTRSGNAGYLVDYAERTEYQHAEDDCRKRHRHEDRLNMSSVNRKLSHNRNVFRLWSRVFGSILEE